MSQNIVVLGSVNADLVVSGNSLPRPGETVTGGRFFKAHGGKGANQAVAAKRLAADTRVTFIGAIGDDSFGQDARAALMDEGIDVSNLHTQADTATGVALIIVNRFGENMISVAAGANAMVDLALMNHIGDHVSKWHLCHTPRRAAIDPGAGRTGTSIIGSFSSLLFQLPFIRFRPQ